MPEYYNGLNVKLTDEQAKVNAVFIRNYLLVRGWSNSAICGMLGNFDAETGGTLNPNVYEGWYVHSSDLGKYGYGLAQWTPWLGTTAYNTAEEQRHYHGTNNPTFGRWCIDNDRDKSTIEAQLDYLNLGLGGYKKTSSYSETFQEFKTSDDSASHCAKVFYVNYERSAAGTWGDRPDRAEEWEEYFESLTGGDDPDQPVIPPPSSEDNAELIAKAVTWAKNIANDDSHGYDQTNRWGLDYDCSSLIIQAYEYAGVPVKSKYGATYTGDMIAAFAKAGFTQLGFTGSSFVPMIGDVLWMDGHVAMYIGNNQIVEAMYNENYEATGGKTGDQTGEEICINEYAYERAWWYVLRLTSKITPAVPVKPEYRRLSKLLMLAIGSDRF